MQGRGGAKLGQSASGSTWVLRWHGGGIKVGAQSMGTSTSPLGRCSSSSCACSSPMPCRVLGGPAKGRVGRGGRRAGAQRQQLPPCQRELLLRIGQRALL